MTAAPRVSVLMSVYNGARYLREAVDSILGQSFGDFEFIIVDDGSSDETPAILDSYRDKRIIRLRNETNIGLTRSLNKGLAAARGEYVARQDADDVSLPERLARQVAFLDEHPTIAAVGTAYIEAPEDGSPERLMLMPTEPDMIREQLFYRHCFCHGSVMLRRVSLLAVGGYDESFAVAQDRDLWLRLAEQFELANLAQPLYRLRMSVRSITGTVRARQREASQRAVQQALQRGILRPSAEAVGRFHWLHALDILANGDCQGAAMAIAQAMSAHPALDGDALWLTQAAVYRAFEVIASTKTTQEGFAFLEDLFSLLPAELKQLHAQRRRALGELSAACAFLHARRGEARAVRQSCVRAWRSGFAHWRNLGLLSIFVRSWRMKRREARG